MRDREEPKPTLKCQNIDSKNLEKKLLKFEKEIFYTEEECLFWSRDRRIRKCQQFH